MRSGCTVPAVSLASKGAPRLPPGRSLAALRRRRVTHNLRGAPDTPLLARSAGDKNGPIYPSRTLRARRCYASSAICEAQHAGAERRAAPRRAPRGVTAMRPWGRGGADCISTACTVFYCVSANTVKRLARCEDEVLRNLRLPCAGKRFPLAPDVGLCGSRVTSQPRYYEVL